MSDITLIQIVSDQAMPNLLAAMALQPARIVHLCSDTPAVRKGADCLTNAYKASGLHAEVFEERLSPMPSMREVWNVVARLLCEDEKTVLNFTGGTKLMSIGAYAAALSVKHPSLYVDTSKNVIVDGGTPPGIESLFPNRDTTISQIARRLSVPLVAIANGVERVTGGKDWKPFLPLAAFLLNNPDVEDQVRQWAADAMKQPTAFKERQAWILKRYEAPLPDWLETIAAPAIESGLFERRDGGLFLEGRWKQRVESFTFAPGVNPRLNYTAKKDFLARLDEAVFPLQFLEGSWWEVVVAEYLSRRGDCRDIRWSVQAGSRGADSTDMEEDILGIADGLNLLYVSCKRGGDRSKLSRFLEEIEASAKRIGGSFAKKIFALCLPPNPHLLDQLKGRAEDLHIELVTRDDVLAEVRP